MNDAWHQAEDPLEIRRQLVKPPKSVGCSSDWEVLMRRWNQDEHRILGSVLLSRLLARMYPAGQVSTASSFPFAAQGIRVKTAVFIFARLASDPGQLAQRFRQDKHAG